VPGKLEGEFGSRAYTFDDRAQPLQLRHGCNAAKAAEQAGDVEVIKKIDPSPSGEQKVYSGNAERLFKQFPYSVAQRGRSCLSVTARSPLEFLSGAH
jgi:hypothetical protein